jgi:hypothetical protein
MKPEAQRIAIAEACGWIKFWEPGDEEQIGKWKWHRGNSNVSWRNLPDYLNDLNAMHEAEGTLDSATLHNAYLPELQRITDDICMETHWRASAKDRAKAFLRTLGRWEA